MGTRKFAVLVWWIYVLICAVEDSSSFTRKTAGPQCENFTVLCQPHDLRLHSKDLNQIQTVSSFTILPVAEAVPVPLAIPVFETDRELIAYVRALNVYFQVFGRTR